MTTDAACAIDVSSATLASHWPPPRSLRSPTVVPMAASFSNSGEDI
jgi:hypothetical protein